MREVINSKRYGLGLNIPKSGRAVKWVTTAFNDNIASSEGIMKSNFWRIIIFFFQTSIITPGKPKKVTFFLWFRVNDDSDQLISGQSDYRA